MTTESEEQAKANAAADEQQRLYTGNEPLSKLQTLRITQLRNNGIELELSGGCMAEIGATFGVSAPGGKYTPMYSKRGFSTVRGLLFDDTEFKFSFDVPFFRPADHVVRNAESPSRPEELVAIFQTIAEHGCDCNVTIGPFFARIGKIRSIGPTPKSGYMVDTFDGKSLVTPGMNLDVTVKWEWNSEGLTGPESPPFLDVVDVTQQLARAAASMNSALSDKDPFEPDLLERLSGTIGRLNGAVGSLRQAMGQIGSLASAPKNATGKIIAAAKNVQRLTNEINDNLDDASNFIAHGGRNFSVESFLGIKRTCGKVRQDITITQDVVAAILLALEKQSTRSVGVRPGGLLTDVAAKELGNADRWQEIADLNEIAGKTVPRGVYSVYVKG